MFQWSSGALLRKLFKEFGDLVRNVARDDLVRVLVVRSANVAWWHSDLTGIIGNKGIISKWARSPKRVVWP